MTITFETHIEMLGYHILVVFKEVGGEGGGGILNIEI
jgi:hypothetical protein